MDVLAQAQVAYNQKAYAKGAELYLQAHRAKANPVALYNAICCLALTGEKERAFALLDELAKIGYNDATLVKEDTDLASLRGDARWAALVARFEENERRNPSKRWRKPYQVAEVAKDATGLPEWLSGRTSRVGLDEDVLTFVYKGEAQSVEVTAGIQEKLTRIPNTDYWVLRLKMDGWDRALVSYAFLVDNQMSGLKLETWRGENAPALPARAATLQGKMIECTFASPALGEDRKLLVYLPPNAPKELPAFFLADGEAAKGYAEVLEPLILVGQVRPCAIVGIASGGYRGDRTGGYDPAQDFRAKEYVNGQDPDRFAKHLTFFTEEVPAYVAKEFGISSRAEDRAVIGFSNGGAFSAAVAYRYPDRFGAAIPLSLGIPPDVPMPAKLPRMFFAAGSLETFSRSTEMVYDQVRAAQPSAKYDRYVAGHDPTMWQIAFTRFAPEVFAGASRPGLTVLGVAVLRGEALGEVLRERPQSPNAVTPGAKRRNTVRPGGEAA
jgi:enterochelin esterase-like enzyme